MAQLLTDWTACSVSSVASSGTGAFTLSTAKSGGPYQTPATAGAASGDWGYWSVKEGTTKAQTFKGTLTYSGGDWTLSRDETYYSTAGGTTNETFTSAAVVELSALALSVGVAAAFVDGQFFGDGSDGDVTLSGAATLTRDMHYNNCTPVAGCAINTATFRIFVKNTLDLANAPAGAFVNNGAAGGAASGATGGASGGTTAATVVNELGANTSGTAGKNGGSGAGTAATGGTANNYMGGSQSGDVGAGGSANSGGTAGGAGLTQAASTFATGLPNCSMLTPLTLVPNTGVAMQGGGGASGGGSGGNGGGGGAGGSSGGAVGIFARTINRGGSTAAGCIQAKGGKGGNGGNGTAGNSGGGAGGPGGAGGMVWIAYRYLTGSTATGAIDVSGGAGGNGGNGVGTGAGGQGSGSGAAGGMSVANVGNATGLHTRGTQTRNGVGNASGTTGGTGGASVSVQLDL